MALEEKDLELIAGLISKSLTDHETKINGMVSAQVNGAVKTHLKPLREKADSALSEERVAALLQEKLDALEVERQKKAEEAGSKGKDPRDVELADLKARLDASERKAKKDQEDRAANDLKTKRVEERAAVQTALNAAGIIPALVRPTLAGLFDSGAITRNKEGAIVYVRRGEYGDEQLALEDGIKAYLETDEGKAALPPKNAAGTGERGTGNKGAGGEPKKMTPQMAAEILSNPTV
jgi:hypothetical protein